ncbi:MAG: hypothetical protein IJY55_00605 [Clostridia bacterium]|nr:hypothetical protein [Clostridia bacterium]
METRRKSRGVKKETNPQKGEVKIFIQLMVCVALICGFMIFKDTPLPNGKTPAEYVSHFLNTTVNMEEIVKKLNPDGDVQDSVPVSGSAEE